MKKYYIRGEFSILRTMTGGSLELADGTELIEMIQVSATEWTSALRADQIPYSTTDSKSQSPSSEVIE